MSLKTTNQSFVTTHWWQFWEQNLKYSVKYETIYQSNSFKPVVSNLFGLWPLQMKQLLTRHHRQGLRLDMSCPGESIQFFTKTKLKL